MLSKLIKKLERKFMHFFRVNKQLVQTILVILIIQSFALIGVLSFIHNPNIGFDESNTIRIARQNPADILTILSHEQNFPLYYLTLHKLFVSIPLPSELIATGFNYILWFASCLLFYQLMKQYTRNKTWSLFFTLFYIYTSPIMNYAFFVRMYGLINLCILGHLFAAGRYAKTPQLRWIIMQSCICFLLATLHPLAIILLPCILLTNALQGKNIRHFLIISVSVLGAMVTVLLQMFTKINWYPIYVSQGRAYLQYMHSKPYELTADVLFSLHGSAADTVISPVLFLFFLYLSYRVIKTAHVRKQTFLPVIILCSEFLVLDLFFFTKLSIHHFIIFSIPVLIIVLLGIFFSSGRQRMLLLVGFLCIFVPPVTYNFARLVVTEISVPEFCTGIQKTKGATIIVENFTYNAVEYCLQGNHTQVVMLEPERTFNTASASTKTILLHQADDGGAIPLIYQPNEFVLPALTPLKKFLEQPTAPARISYIKFTPEYPYLTPQELLLFHNYRLIAYFHPRIFTFEKR